MKWFSGFSEVSRHRNLGGVSLDPGYDLTDDALSGRVAQEGMLPLRI